MKKSNSKPTVKSGVGYRIKSSTKPTAKTAKKTSSKKTNTQTYIQKPLPSTRTLMRSTVNFFWKNKAQLIGVSAVYGFLYLLLVTGVNGVVGLNEALDTSASSGISDSLSLAGSLFAESLSGEEGSQFYQTFLPVIGSLAMIWAIREIHNKSEFRMKDAYYKGMYPLIPYFLVNLTILLKLLPMAIASYVLALLQLTGLLVSPIEYIFAFGGWILLSVWSLYMLPPSLLALYSVTLPDIYPMRAIKGAKAFSAKRRMRIIGRYLLALAVGLSAGLLILLAIIAIVPALAVYVSLILGIVGLLVFHIFGFELYRSML